MPHIVLMFYFNVKTRGPLLIPMAEARGFRSGGNWVTDSSVGLRVCSKSPMLWSVSVVACTETDPGTSPRSADGASTESC